MALSVFLTIIVLLKLLTFSTSEETCEKIDVCSCKLKNGSTVNLKPVDGGSKGPRFTNIAGAAGSGRTFDWNPCTPFDTTNGCKNVMVCQVLYAGDKNAGTEKDTTFSVDDEGNVVVLYGPSEDSDVTRQSKITLKCDPSEPGNGTIPRFTESSLSPQASLYSGTFTSKYACAMGGRVIA